MRLIDADALEKKLQEQRELYVEMGMKGAEHLLVHDFLRYVWEAPTIDHVQVVRCEDCKHSQYDELFHMRWCNGEEVKNDDFCSYGAKMDLDTTGE